MAIKVTKSKKTKIKEKNRRRHLPMTVRTALEAYFFMSPFIIGILAFFAYPIILLLMLSFGKLQSIVGLKIQFVGLDNFKQAFFSDMQFIPYLLETLEQTLIKVPLTIVFSLLIAILVNKNIRFRGFFRTAFFLPFLLGNGYVMQQLYDQNVSGRAIQTASSFFMPPEVLEYLGTSATNIVTGFFSIIIVIFWGCGVQILLFLSGLQGISQAYYEAARVESANEWDCFWHITLPMISPIILLCIVYSMVDSFMNINNPILNYTKTLAFSNQKFDYSAALSLIYSVLLLMIIMLVFIAMRRVNSLTDNRKGR
jgi:ABC-type sugar transport system permease subunit